MNHQVVETAKNAFLDNGYTVVTFDARYSLGESYGNVSNVSLSTFLEDLETVVPGQKNKIFTMIHLQLQDIHWVELLLFYILTIMII